MSHQKLLTNQIKTGDLVTVKAAAHLAVSSRDIRGIPIYHNHLPKKKLFLHFLHNLTLIERRTA